MSQSLACLPEMNDVHVAQFADGGSERRNRHGGVYGVLEGSVLEQNQLVRAHRQWLLDDVQGEISAAGEHGDFRVAVGFLDAQRRLDSLLVVPVDDRGDVARGGDGVVSDVEGG